MESTEDWTRKIPPDVLKAVIRNVPRIEVYCHDRVQTEVAWTALCRTADLSGIPPWLRVVPIGFGSKNTDYSTSDTFNTLHWEEETSVGWVWPSEIEYIISKCASIAVANRFSTALGKCPRLKAIDLTLSMWKHLWWLRGEMEWPERCWVIGRGPAEELPNKYRYAVRFADMIQGCGLGRLAIVGSLHESTTVFWTYYAAHLVKVRAGRSIHITLQSTRVFPRLYRQIILEMTQGDYDLTRLQSVCAKLKISGLYDDLVCGKEEGDVISSSYDRVVSDAAVLSLDVGAIPSSMRRGFDEWYIHMIHATRREVLPGTCGATKPQLGSASRISSWFLSQFSTTTRLSDLIHWGLHLSLPTVVPRRSTSAIWSLPTQTPQHTVLLQ